MLSYCKSKGAKNGKIGTIPEVRGIGVFKDGHVGIYIGNGQVIEAKGFNYGVIKSRLKDTPWTAWAYFPFITYLEGGFPVEPPKEFKLGERDLKSGMNGNDVKELQTLLNSLKYLGVNGKVLDVDGEFGKNTASAVEKFEKAFGLSVNGIFTTADYVAYQNYKPTTPTIPTAPTHPVVTDEFWTSTGSDVNVRTGPSSAFESIGKVNKGDKIKKLAYTGWTPVYHDNKAKWISSTYFKNGAVTGSTVNIRKGPGTNYDKDGLAKKDERLIQIFATDWTPVVYKDQVAWIFTKYLK